MVPSLSLIVLLTDPPLIATIILKPVNRVTLQISTQSLYYHHNIVLTMNTFDINGETPD